MADWRRNPQAQVKQAAADLASAGMPAAQIVHELRQRGMMRPHGDHATPEELDATADECVAAFGFVSEGMIEQRAGRSIRYVDVYAAAIRAEQRHGLERRVCELSIEDRDGLRNVVSAARLMDRSASTGRRSDRVSVLVSNAADLNRWFIGRVCWAVGPTAVHLSNLWD